MPFKGHHDSCLDDYCKPSIIQPRMGWGEIRVWHIKEINAIIVETLPAFHYLMSNRFQPPEVNIYYFQTIMSMVYEAVQELKNRLMFPLFAGALPLSQGLPSEIVSLPIRCSRVLVNGKWEGVSQEMPEIPISITFGSKDEANIKATIIDECTASSTNLKMGLRKGTKKCHGIAKRLIEEKKFSRVSIELNIFVVWMSQIGLERVRAEFQKIKEEYTDDQIYIHDLGTPIVCMGLSALTPYSTLYGIETGLPPGNTTSLISRSFDSHIHELTQGTEICGVGDVGISIGNIKPDKFKFPELAILYGHRASVFEEVKIFGIDHKTEFWEDRLKKLWMIEGITQFLQLEKPGVFEHFARIFGYPDRQHNKATNLGSPIPDRVPTREEFARIPVSSQGPWIGTH